MIERILFTVDLYNFLLKEGFTHIEYVGLENATINEGEDLQDKYILRPAKYDITQRFEEAEIRVEEISSPDVLEMLEYTLGIDFYIELPLDTAIKYRQRK